MRIRRVPEPEAIVGSGAAWVANESTRTVVRYELEIADNGTVRGIVTALPGNHLCAWLANRGEVLLLQTACGRLVSFGVQAYQRRPGGAAHIVGYLLPARVWETAGAAA